MSRNPPPNPSARYKISSPQPFVANDLRSAYTGSDSGPYPSFPPAQQPSQQAFSLQEPYRNPLPSSSRQNGEPSRDGGPVRPAQGQGHSPASPARPARSRMRDAPQPPSVPGVGSNYSSAPAHVPAPAPSRRDNLRPIQTSNIRRPSAASSTGSHDLAASPISPISPNALNHQGSTALFSDPFEADRAQRSQLRAQTTAAAQQAQQPFQGGPGSDKLRSVVGAFMSASRSRDEPSASARRPARSEARTKKPQKEDLWEVGEGDGGKFGDIDDVLRKIRKDWPFVLESDFSPSTLALSLLSHSSTSSLPSHPGLSSFMRLHESLSTSLQTAVQAHFQSFAASLPAHATFIATLSKAQEQVKKSKEALREARDGFAGKGKSELAGIRARERMVRDMLKILDTIDQLKQIPDQLESLIGDKRFLQAALILVRSLKTINKPELAEIGALSDLRAYFVAQETTLTDILVEELHSHLYLKTFYSDSRWKSYVPGQQDLPIIGPNNDVDLPPLPPSTKISLITSPSPNGDASAVAGPGPSSRFSRYLNHLASKPSHDPMLDFTEADLGTTPAIPANSHSRVESNSIGQAGSHGSLASLISGSGHQNDGGNPEADSYAYMETLLEALASMGKLGAALDMVAQRVPGEIHALVETTLDEVEERSEQRREEVDQLARPQSFLASGGDMFSSRPDSSLKRKSLFAPAETLRIEVSLGATGPPQHAAILKDLFWTLYSKLAAVLEGHRVVYEVARWISSRRDFKDTSVSGVSSSFNVPVNEVWKPVQQEVRTILRTYLTDESQGSNLDRHPIMSINEVLRDGKVARDKQKQMFKFSDTDTRAVQKEIKTVDDSLQQALRASVPGLVSMQVAGENTLTVLNDADDRYSSVGRHRTLIPANAFNVTTLFQPTLSFIQRATSIVPPGFEDSTGAFSTVLEDFVVKVFLPQLDEKVTASFRQAVSGYDAYQVDRTLGQDLAVPPLKSSVRVMALLHSLCVMLQTTPFHRENYSRLIVGVIVQYYQQCSARFKELASLPTTLENATESNITLPAEWAQREDMIKILSELRAVSGTDRAGLNSVEAKEIKLELELLGDQGLVEKKLINSMRRLEALANLSQSLRWFIDSLLDLQSVAEEPLSPEGEDPPLELTLPVAPPLSTGGDEPRLPLTRAMAQRYQAIIQTYEQLAEMVLNTIRLEIRGRVICNLGASLRKGDFRLESEAFEPDPDVLDLNVSLMEIEAIAERTILGDDHSFIFRGLGQLVDQIFISSSKNIKMVNPAGVRKIKRNILALQQTLRGIKVASFEGGLERAVEYWNLYEKGPKDMLEDLKAGKPHFSFEDYNTMLNLQCKAEQDDAPTSELNTYLIDLHALSMSIEGWEIGES
ncbi:exocyst complex component 4 [Kwoniella heveanensis CBS 569]|nr:exocyst complex component 4 [Kwoniella heveanensis CBS 569]